MTNRISQSVGEGGINNRQDVGIVQHLLNRVGKRTGERPLDVDGVVGPKTLAAIRAFQARYCAQVKVIDGRIDPGSETIAMLNRLAFIAPKNDGVSFLTPNQDGLA